jgi:tRNA(fMet)-specific endonuclease VapC
MILDTKALSAFADGAVGVADAMRSSVRAAIPVIVLGEFRYGIAQSRHRALYESWLHAHVPEFEILEVTASTAGIYADLCASLRRLGRAIPANGAWIAALALEHGLELLSRDEHFDVVPGLQRRAW